VGKEIAPLYFNTILLLFGENHESNQSNKGKIQSALENDIINAIYDPAHSGLTEVAEKIKTKFRRPPQVKSSKAQIHAKYHIIPGIRSPLQVADA
jgi:hypothetical protein